MLKPMLMMESKINKKDGVEGGTYDMNAIFPNDLTDHELNFILAELVRQGDYSDSTKKWETAPDLYAEKAPSSAEATKQENQIVQFFNRIVETTSQAFTVLRHSQKDNHTSARQWVAHGDSLVENRHKADLVLVNPYNPKFGLIKEDELPSIVLLDIISTLEHKYSNSPALVQEVFQQIANNAFFCLSSQFDRSQFIGFTLCGPDLRICKFNRGGNETFGPLNIDENPRTLVRILYACAYCHEVKFGYDASFVKKDGSITLMEQPVKVNSEKFTNVTPLFLFKGLIGRGTRIFVAASQKNGSVIIKDCWHVLGDPTDGEIHVLLRSPTRDRTLSLPPNTNASYIKSLITDVFDDNVNCIPGEKGHWDDNENLHGIPILYNFLIVKKPDGAEFKDDTTLPDLQDPQNDDETSNDDGETSIPVLVSYASSNKYEHRVHARATFLTCAVGITWFSCVRELINGFMGAIIGHWNGCVRRDILHCDISDTNTWIRIKHALAEYAVPDWPEGKRDDLQWYPKRSGVAGDWGYAEDMIGEGNPGGQMRWITGTYPYQAAELQLASELGTSVAHQVHYDLESYFWVFWIICINTDGPFNTHRQWETLKASKNIAANTAPHISAVDLPLPSPSPSHSASPGDIAGLPLWATSGIHSVDPLTVTSQKKNMSLMQITAVSSYFFKHNGVKKGLVELYKLFRWQEGDNVWEDAPPTQRATHQQVLEILKTMHDSIDPTLDGPPSQELIDAARNRYNAMIARGQTETPVLGNRVGSSKNKASTEGSEKKASTTRKAKNPAKNTGSEDAGWSVKTTAGTSRLKRAAVPEQPDTASPSRSKKGRTEATKPADFPLKGPGRGRGGSRRTN